MSKGKSKGKNRGRKSNSKRSLFFPPKNRKIADIIKIDSPKNAESSIKKLRQLIDKGKITIDQAIKYVTVAANRSKASLNRKNLSKQERKEMRQVANLYNSFKEDLKKAKKIIGLK
jgi:polyhydroxyalkanoate synthesis regulator phasin